MAKMYALNTILLPDDEPVEKHSVFDASPTLAKQLMALKSARNATKAEIDAAEAKAAAASGTANESVKKGDAKVIATNVAAKADPKPASEAKGDPQGAPKGKAG